jgi:hypothetical protein
MSGPDDDLFRGWTPTPAPPHLKARVVSAAREKGADTQPKKLTDRLWESRALRYGWAVAATALVALNLWLPTPMENVSHRAATVAKPVGFDPVLASLMEDRLPPRTTWADQTHLMHILLGEARTVADDATTFGGTS